MAFHSLYFWYLAAVAAMHACFMLLELFPWSEPYVLNKQLPVDAPRSGVQMDIMRNTLHNAGIYNGVLSGCLFWAAFHDPAVIETAHVLLAGVAVAGIFGAITLKNWGPGVQALAGLVGLFLL